MEQDGYLNILNVELIILAGGLKDGTKVISLISHKDDLPCSESRFICQGKFCERKSHNQI